MPVLARWNDTGLAYNYAGHVRVVLVTAAVVAVLPGYFLALALLVALDSLFWYVRQRPWQVLSFFAALGLGEGLKYGTPWVTIGCLVAMIFVFIQVEDAVRAAAARLTPEALRDRLIDWFTVWKPLPGDPVQRAEQRWGRAMGVAWLATFAALAVLPWDLLGGILLRPAGAGMGRAAEFAATLFVATVLSVPWWYLRLRGYTAGVIRTRSLLREAGCLLLVALPAAAYYAAFAPAAPPAADAEPDPWYYGVLGIDSAQINLKWVGFALAFALSTWAFMVDKLAIAPHVTLKEYVGLALVLAVLVLVIPAYLIALTLLGAACVYVMRSLRPSARWVLLAVPAAVVAGEITRHDYPVVGVLVLATVGISADAVAQEEKKRGSQQRTAPAATAQPPVGSYKPAPPPPPPTPDPVAAREMLDHIGRALADPDPAVRAAAAAAAGHAGDPDLAHQLAALARTDPDPAARVAAIQALVRCSPALAREVFDGLLRVPGQALAVRWAVVLASSEAVPPRPSPNGTPGYAGAPLVEDLS
jgi:hypothetical protein